MLMSVRKFLVKITDLVSITMDHMPVHVKLDGRVNIVKMVNKFIMSYPLVKIEYIPLFEAKKFFFRKTKCECTHYTLFWLKP